MAGYLWPSFSFPNACWFQFAKGTPHSHLPAGGRYGLSVKHMEQDARPLSRLKHPQTMSPMVAFSQRVNGDWQPYAPAFFVRLRGATFLLL